MIFFLICNVLTDCGGIRRKFALSIIIIKPHTFWKMKQKQGEIQRKDLAHNLSGRCGVENLEIFEIFAFSTYNCLLALYTVYWCMCSFCVHHKKVYIRLKGKVEYAWKGSVDSLTLLLLFLFFSFLFFSLFSFLSFFMSKELCCKFEYCFLSYWTSDFCVLSSTQTADWNCVWRLFAYQHGIYIFFCCTFWFVNIGHTLCE